MTKLRKNENGFSALDAILVVIVIIGLCVLGYMIYKRHH